MWWEVIPTGIELHLDFGPDELAIEDREVTLLGRIEWDEVSEKHPLWGSSACPEPGTIEYETHKLTELYIAKFQGKKDQVSERILEKRNTAQVGNDVYALVADLEEMGVLTEKDWEQIEEKIIKGV